MLVFQYVISNTGSLIWPSALPVNQNLDTIISPSVNQITCIYYNGISSPGPTGVITPNTPVLSGLSGTINIQARTTIDSPWSNIKNGLLDLSTGGNMAFPGGSIYQVNAVCTGVTGCNYILIRFDMGV